MQKILIKINKYISEKIKMQLYRQYNYNYKTKYLI